MESPTKKVSSDDAADTRTPMHGPKQYQLFTGHIYQAIGHCEHVQVLYQAKERTAYHWKTNYYHIYGKVRDEEEYHKLRKIITRWV